MNLKRTSSLALAMGASLLAGAQTASAAEGAFSNYFPGAYGTLLPGMAPEPGTVLQSVNLFYSGDTDFAVRQGQVDVNLSADSFITLVQGLYVWDLPDVGGRFAIGGYVPYAYSEMSGSIRTGIGNIPFSADVDGFGDIGIIPASYFWSSGNFHFNLYELIFAPTGKYDVDADLSVGRNYWSFDTVLAMTWFNPETGTDLSAVGGIMINTENPDTNYRTGTEFHLDLAANQFLTEEFAVGLRGYFYHQLTGDSGSGAVLGDFKGASAGAGLGLSWIPKSAGGQFSFTASWVRDFYTKNRLDADYGAVSLAFTF